MVETGEYYVLAGHHRLEAMRNIKKNPKHAHIKFQANVVRGSQEEFDSQDTTIKSIMSNAMRRPSTLMEMAAAVGDLKKSGLSLPVISEVLAQPKRYVEKLYAVSILPEEIKDFVAANPNLSDDSIIRLSMKFRDKPSESMLSAFERMAKRRQGAVTAQAPKKSHFKKSLNATGSLTPQQIKTVMKVYSDILEN